MSGSNPAGSTMSGFSDPATGDLIPSMRSVQLTDDDRRRMSDFKHKVDESGQFESEETPLYRGRHIPSRLFRALDSSVSGGEPPANSRIGGPGQKREVVINMHPGTGQQQHCGNESTQKVSGSGSVNIPSRSFHLLQQMTDHESGSQMAAPSMQHSRRSPSHYADSGAPTTVTAAPHANVASHAEPTCERLERESRAAAAQQSPSSHSGVTATAKTEHANVNLVPTCERLERESHFASTCRPAADTSDTPSVHVARINTARAHPHGQVPSRVFHALQQQYGIDDNPADNPGSNASSSADRWQQQQSDRSMGAGIDTRDGSDRINTSAAYEKERADVSARLAATSKTYRLLQTDPASVPSVFGKNKR